MKDEEKVSMVQECTTKYEAHNLGDDGLYIEISVDRRFANLWMCKLSDLHTTENEIAEYEKP